MKDLIGHFSLAISFFSRIPLPHALVNQIDRNATLANAVTFFPVAGLVISLVPALVWYVSGLFLPSLVAAGLGVISLLLITGALHEDGLADCADGLGATHDRRKALEIMRDSRIGTYGTIALITSVGLRWALLASFAPLAGVLAILTSQSVSRATITIAMQFASYARPEGLGKSVDDGMPDRGFVFTTAIALLLAFVLCGFTGLIAVVIAYLAALGVLAWLKSRLGGYTGDGLGAMQQVAEITILLVLAANTGMAFS